MQDTKRALIQAAMSFHAKMVQQDKLRQKSVGESVAQVTLRVLGQTALIADEAASRALKPIATQDLDAVFLGGVERDALKQELSRAGFLIDKDSEYVWIVPGASYHTIFQTEFVKIELLDPIYNLASKAVKAPDKNRELVQRGLLHYGIQLFQLIKEHGGDIERFR